MANETVIQKGDKVICPTQSCRKIVGKIKKSFTHIYFYQEGYDIKRSYPYCPKCKGRYFFEGKFHTLRGWL